MVQLPSWQISRPVNKDNKIPYKKLEAPEHFYYTVHTGISERVFRYYSLRNHLVCSILNKENHFYIRTFPLIGGEHLRCCSEDCVSTSFIKAIIRTKRETGESSSAYRWARGRREIGAVRDLLAGPAAHISPAELHGLQRHYQSIHK